VRDTAGGASYKSDLNKACRIHLRLVTRYRQTAKQKLLTWQSRSDVCRAIVAVVTVVCMQKQWAQYECIISMNVLCTPTYSRVSRWMKKRMALENRKLPDKWEMLLSLASQACTQLSDGKTQITTWNDSAVFFYDTFYGRDSRVKNYNSVEASNSLEESAANINWLVRKFLRLFQKPIFRYADDSVTALHPEPDATSSHSFVYLPIYMGTGVAQSVQWLGYGLNHTASNPVTNKIFFFPPETFRLALLPR
jgi:hypothetical protein